MAKFVDYVNTHPEYYEYLRDRVEASDIQAESLSEEEIEAIKEQEKLELEELKELVAMMDDAMN